MKKIATKFIFALGLLSLLLIIYASSFYLLLNYVVRPFEAENSGQTHAIRPVYNIVYHPLRWFVANGTSFKAERNDIYFGTLTKEEREDPKMAHANIHYKTRLTMIGFTGEQSLLNAYNEIEDGSYVKMTFGSALSKDSDRYINRLIDFEVIDLIDDPRITSENLPPDQERQIRISFRKLSDKAKICVNTFLDDYVDLVYLHCTQTGYAHNIGGGCAHLIGNPINMTVKKHALNSCLPQSIK